MASGDTLFNLFPAMNEAPASNPAYPGERNRRPILRFDDSTDGEAIFTVVMPQHYANTTGVTCIVEMSSETDQTTGSVAWEILFERVIEDSTNLDADSFATSASGNRFTQAAPAGSSQPAKDSKTIAKGTLMDSVVAGDTCRIKIRRDADGTSQTDDMTGDAELYRIEVKET